MPGHRGYGMDHTAYDWSPITKRPALRWPEGARVALCVIVNFEHYEWTPPQKPYILRFPYPDLRNFSQREYGNRVGVFRVMDALDRHGIRAIVALDATVAENYPFLVEECRKRGWEFIGHGQSVNRYITSEMSEAREREYIRTSIEAVAKATGHRPTGWLGPGYSESSRTPELLAQEGIRYLCDWPNDDQPYPMKAAGGRLYSLPMTMHLDDVTMLVDHRAPVMRYARLVQETFDVLRREGGDTGRMMVLNLHPWLIGQPYRSKYLEQALAHVGGHKDVWKATGTEIIDWCAASADSST